MSSVSGYSDKELHNTLYLLFNKIVEELVDAYLRTPDYISSKAHILRALRLAQTGTSLCKSILTKNQKI